MKTPLLESTLLNERIGGRLLIKAEPLQRTGSFKFRGAYNCISRIPEEAREGGVVAYSSGNHAQGVAAASQILGLRAVIVMPQDAPAIKIANTRAYGADIVFYDRYSENREEIGERLMAESGATLVRPYDDAMIIAGQGTIGLEAAQQARGLKASLDAFLAPCGGGGLISGCALALKDESPETDVYAVEPVGYDDTARSLVAGKPLANDMTGKSICDALLAPVPGDLTYRLNAKLLKSGLAVSDEQVREAMRTAFEYFKLVVEPGGAVALAAILAGLYYIKNKTACAVLSGGNVDPAVFRDALKN